MWCFTQIFGELSTVQTSALESVPDVDRNPKPPF